MSRTSSGIIHYDCGFDHGQGVSCGGHEFELVFHRTSDTVALITDGDAKIMSDGEFDALLDAIQIMRDRGELR